MELRPDIAAWFRIYSDSLHSDPYPFYQYLLEKEPVYFIEELRFWVVSRYEYVNRILKDPMFVKEYRNAVPQQETPPSAGEWKPLNDLLDNWMLNRDAPDHTRLRGLVSHAFTPKMMAQIKEKIHGIAEHLADQMAHESKPDLIASFAFPLPVIVIAELLGVPAEDRELFKAWSHTFAAVLEATDHSPEFARHANGVASEMSDYFGRMITERRSAPREDLISGMVCSQEKMESLTDKEIIATCTLLLVAGHETTVNLIGNSVRTLLTHPEQFELLLNKPELIPSAIEEILRFESPVQMTSRFASADCEMHGKTICQGQVVNVMLAAANRDPAKFKLPDQFDIGRTQNHHLAFASGPHFCLGAPLARMEAEIAIATLMKRFPHMNLADDRPDWRPLILFRGLRSLPLQLEGNR